MQSNFGQVKVHNRSGGMDVHHSSDHIEIKRNLPPNSDNFLIKYIKKIRLCQIKDF